MGKNSPRFPKIIYGTAWKEHATGDLAKKAIAAGFDAIDTANQKKHYREDFLGEALIELKNQGLERKSLVIQSKYTYQRGQDHRLPYDPADSYTDQLKSSFKSSLKNLGTGYLDSFLMHGPMLSEGLHDADWEVWEAMEDLCRLGKARQIGVSNFSFEQIQLLFEQATIKPMYLQNRCYAGQGWDREAREFCIDNEVCYQGFSLLTANREVVNSQEVSKIAQRHQVTPQQVIFSMASSIGIVPLTGTSNIEHMKMDLAAMELSLSDSEIATLKEIGEKL